MTQICARPDRAVIALAGEDRISFLQGLTSNDVTQAAPGQALWSALLTPQGRYLADFFIIAEDERLLLECERAQAEMIEQKLRRFKLRSKVSLEITGLHVAVAWDGVPEGGIPDPRLPDAGYRIISATPIAANADLAAYDAHRIPLGLPDGTRDLEPEKTLLLEAGFDELRGVSFTKGCYMGQELTARTRYRGLVKRRLLPVRGDRALAPGPVMAGEVEAGEVRSVCGEWGLAFLRLEQLDKPLSCNGVALQVCLPAWFA
jgi:tRNA-modifying protein YgfZ